MSHALYRERAHLVAFLATVYPSCVAYNDPLAPGWPVVFVETPEGQLSWHVSPLDLDLLVHVRRDERVVWDAHSTEEKYARLARLVAARAEGGIGE